MMGGEGFVRVVNAELMVGGRDCEGLFAGESEGRRRGRMDGGRLCVGVGNLDGGGRSWIVCVGGFGLEESWPSY